MASWSDTPDGVAVLIAHRRLVLSSPSGDIQVPVRLFQPEQRDGMWICRYEIDWPNRTKSHLAAGIDGMQALILALRTVGAEIYASDYHKSGCLRWFEPNRGYGFPVPANLRELLIGDDVNL
jgi:Domain of unknown function (DUF6968)